MHELNYLTGKPKKFLFDGCKLIYHQDKLQRFLDHKSITPIHIDMGIHKGCNIKCVYCYGIKQGKSAEYIPTDRLLKLVDDARALDIRSIAIIGDGEPTLNPGLYDFVEYGKFYNLDMSVATNGLLLDRFKIKRLTSSLVWLRFNVSGQGAGYDKMHGTVDKWRKFEEVVKLAVEHKHNCTIGLQMVLIPECFDQVIPLATKAIEWGVDYFVIKQYSDGGAGMPMHFDMEEYNKVGDILKQAEEMSNDKTKIIAKWSAIRDTKSITTDMRWGFDRCIDLPFIFQISGNGRCYPCGYLFGNDDYCYGNIVKERLATIVRSVHYWQIISKVKNTPLRELCKGQCRHCETNKFMDRLTKIYDGDLRDALVKMCGSGEQYMHIMENPPNHINFV